MLGIGLGLTAIRQGGAADPTSILGAKLAAWYASGPVVGAPAPSCTITLTGDIAALFGGEPLDISGQMVSKTVPESPADNYAAGGPAVPVSWTGWRGIGYQASDFTTSGTSLHGINIFTADLSAGFTFAYLEATGYWVISGAGITFFFSGTATSKVGLRVDGETGDVEVIVDGVIKTKADEAGLGGALAGLTVMQTIILGTEGAPSLTEGDTYSAQIYTAAADLEDVGFPDGTLDWCGNPIGGSSYVDGLFTTSTGETPVTVDGDPVGLVLDRSGNGNHLIQATATSRPIYRTDGTRHWLEFDGVDDWLYLPPEKYLDVNNGAFIFGVKCPATTSSVRALIGGGTGGYILVDGADRSLGINAGASRRYIDSPGSFSMVTRQAVRINKTLGTLSVRRFGEETEYTNSVAGTTSGLTGMQAVGAFGFDGTLVVEMDLYSLVLCSENVDESETVGILDYTNSVIGGAE